MKPHQLATLVLRLFGIYFLIQAVPTLGMFSTLMVLARTNSQEMVTAFVGSLLPGILMLLIGFLLLAFSARFGGKLAVQTLSDEGASTISFEQVQALAFAAVGLLIFADALPQLVNSVNYLVSLANTENVGDRALNFREGSVAAGTVLKFVLGTILFFGARGIANFWRSLRTFATPNPPQTDR